MSLLEATSTEEADHGFCRGGGTRRPVGHNPPGERRMKLFTAVTVGILTIIAIVHLLRLVAGWQVSVSGFIVPVWWSAPGFIVAAGLAFMLWREARR